MRVDPNEPELTPAQETRVAEIVHATRQSAPVLRLAVMPLRDVRLPEIERELLQTRRRNREYLQRAGRFFASQPEALTALRERSAGLAVVLGETQPAAARLATLVALAADAHVLRHALALDRQLVGAARGLDEARAFTAELDRALRDLVAACVPTRDEVLRVMLCGQVARDLFIRANLKLARRRARAIARHSRLPIEDLEQTAVVGLIQAIDRFDPSYGVPFAAYGWDWIKQRVAREECQADVIRLPQRVQAARGDIRRAMVGALAQGLPATPATVAAQVHLPEHVVAAVLRAEAPVLSLDGVTGHVISETCADESTSQVDAGLCRAERRAAVRAALATCPAREREVLTRLFGIGRPAESVEAVARGLRLTPQRIYQIRAVEIRRLRRPQILARLVQFA